MIEFWHAAPRHARRFIGRAGLIPACPQFYVQPRGVYLAVDLEPLRGFITTVMMGTWASPDRSWDTVAHHRLRDGVDVWGVQCDGLREPMHDDMEISDWSVVYPGHIGPTHLTLEDTWYAPAE